MLFIPALMIGFASVAQPVENNDNSLTVYGQAVISKSAEYADVNIIIEDKDEKFIDSYKRLSQKVEDISSGIVIMGVPKSDISTSTLFTRSYDKLSFFDPDLKEYRISMEMKIRLKDFKRFDNLIITLIQKGITRIQSIEFGINSPDSLGYLGLETALKQAKAKSEIAASNLGLKIAAVISVEEVYDTPVKTDRNYNYQTPFNPGMVSVSEKLFSDVGDVFSRKIEITKKVKVKFRIENKN